MFLSTGDADFTQECVSFFFLFFLRGRDFDDVSGTAMQHAAGHFEQKAPYTTVVVQAGKSGREF